MLTAEGCARRRARLQREMEAARSDLFLTANYRTAYYLSGILGAAESPILFALWQDGDARMLTSVAAAEFAGVVVPLEAYSIERAITRPFHDAANLIPALLDGKPAPSRIAVEFPTMPALFDDAIRRASGGAGVVDATEIVLRLRKRKEEDEIDEIRASLRCAAAGYSAAREAIRPGATEIDVYNAIQAAAVNELGTSMSFPGDFAAGERCIRGGGPPTRRELRPGDLYILDLFPAPALYFGDVCRTFAVGEPTAAQQHAWTVVREAMRIGENAVRPGAAARDVYRAVKEFLDAHEIGEKSFWHHAGHGIGHHGHEAPRLIPGSDDIFEAGDVFTLEPGIYTAALRGGIRLEDNYVLRESGLENLFDYPLGL